MSLALDTRQCSQRVGFQSWSRGVSCQLLDISLGYTQGTDQPGQCGGHLEGNVLGDGGWEAARRDLTPGGDRGETQSCPIPLSNGQQICARHCFRLWVTVVTKADETVAFGGSGRKVTACSLIWGGKIAYSLYVYSTVCISTVSKQIHGVSVLFQGRGLIRKPKCLRRLHGGVIMDKRL